MWGWAGEMHKSLLEIRKKIKTKQLKIAVVGLGYVGFPLAIEFAKKNIQVIGIEIDANRLNCIKRKESYISDVSTKELKNLLSKGYFSATKDFSVIKNCDVVLICVPTPLKRKNLPDISYIKDAVKSAASYIKHGALIVLESTTYPGTTEEELLPIFQSYKLKHGGDFFLCFSPERIDPGNKSFPVNRIPKVIGGINAQATCLGAEFYKIIIQQVVPVSSARTAETVKLLENTFRLINIGLINELAMMAHKMNIDIWEVISAAATKPFGFMPFYPGPGVGGHCLDKNETVFIKELGALKALQMPELIKHIEKNTHKDIEILSFDPIKKKSVFKKITAASVRPYSGKIVNIATEDGRLLNVTDLHPMFIYNCGRWQLKYAKDLQKGDSLPICLGLPGLESKEIPGSSSINTDIINKLKKENKNRPVNKTFKRFDNFATVKVKSTNFTTGDLVYSVETEKPHSFVTSYGIVVHNCIPKDPLYLHWKAKSFGFHSRFIRLASDVISYMPEYVATRIQEALFKKNKKSKTAKILVVGVTYKKDIKDLRQSPSIDLIKSLETKGYTVSYYDPLIPYLLIKGINLKSVNITKNNLAKFDCVVVATDHSSINYKFLLDNTQLIFDTRNVYQDSSKEKVTRL